ncbi:MAG TPA: DUF3592 domain-containing protein [Acidobacteriaceae bacterium]|jgi:hypothetical protein|nr:DUF3592 domain-containing protein [Acidobacteriaceae bacterium]
MFGPSLRDPHVIGTLAAAVLCVGGVTAWLVLRRRPDPEEIERERRADLVRSGRIIDGTILDVSELDSSTTEPREIRFILYKYEIGGVVYECSQEVSALRDHLNPADIRLSYPCSVRYDTRRPENSIVLAENWSGLRTTSQPASLAHLAQPRKPQTSTHLR